MKIVRTISQSKPYTPLIPFGNDGILHETDTFSGMSKQLGAKSESFR